MLEELQERIKQLCSEREMSYYTLAYRSGVSIETMMNIMRGKTKNPGMYTIIKLCDGLGIDIEEFFCGKQ